MITIDKYQNLCQHVTFFFLAVVIIAIPCSNYFMSIGGLGLAGTYLISPKLLSRTKQVLREPFTLLALALFIWHVIGLTWTEDVPNGMKDIRIKLPLLLFPVAIAGLKQLSKSKKLLLIRLFLVSILLNTIFLFVYSKTKMDVNTEGFRDISIFISHIRLSLNILLAIGFIWLYPNIFGTLKHQIIPQLFISFWLIYFLSILESGTSLLFTLLLVALGCIYLIQTKVPRKVRVLSYIGIISLFSCIIFVLNQHYQKNFTVKYTSKPHRYTTNANGSTFWHDTLNKHIENGHYVHSNIVHKELEREWLKKTGTSILSPNKYGYLIKDNAIRYLTSKGQTKDSVGIWSLTETDIKNILRGESNYKYADANGFTKRWYKIMFEWHLYQLNSNPGGHSVLMRIEFVKTAWSILQKNWIIGVGTGDLNETFKKAYEEQNTALKPAWRKRAHNQFISIWLALGVTGLLLFIGLFLYPILRHTSYPNYVWHFLILALTSFLTEDTLETQAGSTFIMFFTSFLFLQEKNKLDL